MNEMSDLKCQILPKNTINEAATVMAAALSRSPVYTYIFQGDIAYRQKALEWLFRKNISFIQHQCPSAFRGIMDTQGKIIACFLWTPSLYTKISTREQIQAGMWLIPFKFGVFTLRRLMHVRGIQYQDENEFYKTINASQEFNFIQLERMAVHPDFQGQNLGTKCLDGVISDNNQYISIRLITQCARNVRFYKRLGFSVVGESKFCQNDEDLVFKNWYMNRPAFAIAETTDEK